MTQQKPTSPRHGGKPEMSVETRPRRFMYVPPDEPWYVTVRVTMLLAGAILIGVAAFIGAPKDGPLYWLCCALITVPFAWTLTDG